MNAEALIGTVLGTCTLQKLIGQGGMGAVFLAQQSRPRRQVAVKVLLPMTPLSPNQLAAFLERFRRETDAAASLEHPNITPVHEYGERDGVAYLVMPYISGGTLRDEMEREGPLPLENVVNYLEQISSALDWAHEHGVIHRDIKPANILMTPEGRLLLTDFGLVKIVAGGQLPQVRLTGAGAPVGTPDYMAPEQVIGEDVDARADLYSLGVILYQMITGTTPFQGETPMQIAAQHLQIPPPSPQMMRPDLPIAAEQVVLRALAKRPSERYSRAQDLANAFRLALINSGIHLEANVMQGTGKLNAITGRFVTPKSLFDPTWQTANVPGVGQSMVGPMAGGMSAHMPAMKNDVSMSMKLPATSGGNGLLNGAMGISPAVTGSSIPTPSIGEPRAGGLLSRTGKFPLVGSATGQMPVATANSPVAAPPTTNVPSPGSQPVALPSLMGRPSAINATTGAYAVPEQVGTNAGSVKLTGPVKVIQMPVAGQPGRFITGLLPVASSGVSENEAGSEELLAAGKKKGGKTWIKVISLILLIVVLIATAGTFWLVRSHAIQLPGLANQQTTGTSTKPAGTPDTKATAQARVTATAQANIILSDPLNQNIHNWLATPANAYVFKDGAYHITDRGNVGRVTVLPANPFTGPVGYTLTMQEVKGDDGSNTNSFGMVFRFSQQNKGGKAVTTFYSLEVVNTKGGEYQFWMYNDSQQGVSPWKKLWAQPFGTEFQQGQGARATNTFKVFMNGKSFTFTVNGKMLKTIQDGMLANGTVGMIVNQEGTEIAFKNLLLTRN